MKNTRKRIQFLKWLTQLEYGVFGIPKPDTIIFLSMPLGLSFALSRKGREKKTYLKGKKDVFKESEQCRRNSHANAQ